MKYKRTRKLTRKCEDQTHHSITLNELDEEVHKYQGREPSGRQFGEIVLDSNSNDALFVQLPYSHHYKPAACIFFQLVFRRVHGS